MANLLLDPNLWRLVSLTGSPPAAWDGECYGESASRFLALRSNDTYEGEIDFIPVNPGDVVAGTVNYDPPNLTIGSRVPTLVVAWFSTLTNYLETVLYCEPVANGDSFSVPITPPVYLGSPTESYLTVFLTMEFPGTSDPDTPPYDMFEGPVGSLICPTADAPASDVCYPPQCGCSLPAC